MVDAALAWGERTTGAARNRCMTLSGRAVGCRSGSFNCRTLVGGVVTIFAAATFEVGLSGAEAEVDCRVSNRLMRVSVGDGGGGIP